MKDVYKQILDILNANHNVLANDDYLKSLYLEITEIYHKLEKNDKLIDKYQKLHDKFR